MTTTTTTTGHAQSLARGDLGQALCRAVDAHTDPAAGRALQEQLRGLGPLVDGQDAGLFYGAPALALILHLAPAGYQRALERLDDANEALTRSRLDAAHARIDHGSPGAFAEYDVIRGLSGLGLLWLHRGTRPALLRDVLAYLVRLSEPAADGRPRWRVWHRPDDPHAPGAHANNALAHGISGPLAVLALARLRGVPVAGHDAALRHVVEHLDTARRGDSTRCWWDRWDGDARTSPPPPSWCYGTAGLIRAQQLAALALGDRARQAQVERTLLHQLQETPAAATTDPCLCHGTAGLLTVGERVAENATAPRPLRRHLERLRTQLPSRPTLSAPGLLEGHAGVDLATRRTPVPWDSFLALV